MTIVQPPGGKQTNKQKTKIKSCKIHICNNQKYQILTAPPGTETRNVPRLLNRFYSGTTEEQSVHVYTEKWCVTSCYTHAVTVCVHVLCVRPERSMNFRKKKEEITGKEK